MKMKTFRFDYATNLKIIITNELLNEHNYLPLTITINIFSNFKNILASILFYCMFQVLYTICSECRNIY